VIVLDLGLLVPIASPVFIHRKPISSDLQTVSDAKEESQKARENSQNTRH
jgi:hypothetical protein